MSKAVSLAKTFERIGYEPHDVQRRIHGALGEHRFRVVCAGRRTGKSTLGGHELTGRAYEAYFRQSELSPHGKRMEYWIVGPEYSDSEKEFRVLYNDLTALEMPLDHPGTYNNPLSGDMHISLWGGRFQVHAKSAKYPDTLVGEALHGVILAEAAKLKKSVWHKYIRPMLADYRGWGLMTSTPEGKNWFYDQYMMPHKGNSEYWSIRMPSWSNSILFPLGREDPEIASMGADLTQEAFNQEIGAEFTEFVGRVFKNFDEDVHCRKLSFNPSYETFAAVDYGWSNPFVWLLIQVDIWGNVYVLDELYKSHLRIDEAPEELKAAGLVPSGLRVFYPDPAAPGDSRVLADKLKIRIGSGTGGELKDRLRLIRKHLDVDPRVAHLAEGHPERLPKLFIDPDKCPNLVREMNDYRYPETKDEKNEAELPMKKDDHAPEALGRFFMGYFGPSVRKRGTRQSKARM